MPQHQRHSDSNDCAIIACLLINLPTGRKPARRTFKILSYDFTGLATNDEMHAHLTKLQAREQAERAPTHTKH